MCVYLDVNIPVMRFIPYPGLYYIWNTVLFIHITVYNSCYYPTFLITESYLCSYKPQQF